ncbi:MAG: histidine--tRNA ligase [Deltaproteobacteria bacterium]|jgi:histidyl-tRNA synthetase|nr:histidine--tRNA ligase [Deltaproteobacteria bacterium]
MTALAAVRGFKDILPDQAGLWRRVEEQARSVAARFGYVELRPPLMEKTELFQRGLGEATDVVEKEMYTMEDRGGERLTLRPEATAGMVRAVLEHNLVEGGRPARLFCLGPMFRYERPQKGRLRQFHQLDVEVFRDPGPLIDAEVVLLLHSFLAELGLGDLQVVVNSLGCASCRPQFRTELISWLTARQENLCPDCRRRLTQNPLRVLDCKNEGCRQATANGPTLSRHLCGPCREHFDGLVAALDLMGLNWVRDHRLVRGLDYYTRTAFEVHSSSLGSQNAVAGGGRYDGLCAQLGGPDVPAVGFAAGLERLVMLLAERHAPAPPGPDYYLAPLCSEALDPGFKLAHQLRARGLSVAADWEVGSLKSRLKRADKLGAAKLIMLGPEELARRETTIRDLAAKEQRALPLDDPGLY